MAEERVQRRLAAIMAADVVGYSRLMETDEAGTLDRLKTLRREVFSPMTAQFGGRIFKLTGDGAFAEFGSVANAVHSAVAIQRALAERKATLPENSYIELRIGISLGDVIVEGSDLYGNGVNVAARMEGLADPGGVCISGNVYEHVAHSNDLEFEDLGDQTVKNIGRPVRCYRVQLEGAETSEEGTDLARSAAQHSNKPSIAVLPFDNLSDDPQQEYFSDGLAEDLITDISKISGVFVTARNSSFAFKGQTIDVKEVAAKLGVKHILEGSIRKMGSKLRINAQLIDAASGGHVWAERYDGDMEDIFEFQDNIREQIVSALEVSLTPTDKALTERKPTDNVEAYDLFLKGRAIFYNYTPERFPEGIRFLEEAIEIDPKFADAFSYLSYLHWSVHVQISQDSEDELELANDLAEKAVALDDTSAQARVRLGFIQMWLRRYDEAIANAEKAVAMGPNNAEVHASFGQVLNYSGNPERGLEMFEKAFNIDTFVSPVWEFQAGVSHFLLHQYDRAMSRLLSAIARSPKLLHAYTYLACTYVEMGRLDDARETIKKALEIAPAYTLKMAEKLFVYRIDEMRNRILNNLREAGLPES